MFISIITVVYNDLNRIRQTMQSVLNQDYSNFEYIIIDGGSIDGTLEVIKSLQTDKVKILSEKDYGIYNAMNKGIKLASGELIGILNAGDTYEPNTLRTISLSHGEVVTGHMHRTNYLGDIVFTNYRYPKNLKKMFEAMPLNHPVTFVKKNIYDKHGSFNEDYKYCADNDFIIRIVKAGIKIQFLDIVLGKMELGGVSENFNSIFKMNQEHFKIRSQHKIKFLPNLILSIKYILHQIISRAKNGLKAL